MGGWSGSVTPAPILPMQLQSAQRAAHLRIPQAYAFKSRDKAMWTAPNYTLIECLSGTGPTTRAQNRGDFPTVMPCGKRAVGPLQSQQDIQVGHTLAGSVEIPAAGLGRFGHKALLSEGLWWKQVQGGVSYIREMLACGW